MKKLKFLYLSINKEKYNHLDAFKMTFQIRFLKIRNVLKGNIPVGRSIIWLSKPLNITLHYINQYRERYLNFDNI